MPRNALVQIRRDTASAWSSTNPVLAQGELGYETDTGKFKIGTGSATWNTLTYASDASKVTGTTLSSSVVNSSLTSLGTLNSLTVTGSVTASSFVNAVPPGAIMPYAGSSAPSGWLLCDGNAYPKDDYLSLWGAIGYTYGGNGSSTFAVPDLKGRVPAGRNSTETEFDTLGEIGGAKTVTLTTAQMPSHTHTQDSHNHTQNSHNHTQDSHNHTQNSHTHTTTDNGSHSHGGNGGTNEFVYRDGAYNTGYHGPAGSGGLALTWNSSTGSAGTHSHTANSQTATNIAQTATNQAQTATNQAQTATNQNTGGGQSHNNLQPYLVLNYIIKT